MLQFFIRDQCPNYNVYYFLICQFYLLKAGRDTERKQSSCFAYRVAKDYFRPSFLVSEYGCYLQSRQWARLFCSQTIFWKEAEARLVIFVICVRNNRNGLFVLFVLRPRNCVYRRRARIFAQVYTRAIGQTEQSLK